MSEDQRKDRLAPVIETIDGIRLAIGDARREGARVGFVPTMGALHAGHRSLIEAARRECGFVVVSIFVNPLQFAPHEDLAKYPRPLEADRRLCALAGADVVFLPSVQTMYPSGFATHVSVEGLTEVLEGAARPTHFRGVTTVVLKLFQMVPADLAYFGQKDYQQQSIIRKMVVDLNLPIRIHVCPTVREPDGLALSSRNVYLSVDERRTALVLYRALTLARQALEQGETDLQMVQRRMSELLTSAPGVQLDYARLVDPDSLAELTGPQPRIVALVAARVGTTRLIDNELIVVPT